jgi:uncharacterized membrane protein YgcG
VVPVPAGEVLDHVERRRLERAVEVAEELSGLSFSVYVGPGEAPARAHAEQLHAALADPDHAVLVFCDPAARVLEIVTGGEARRVLDDFDCRLAAVSMQTSFVAGDLVGGLVNGIQQLGQAARHPETLHTSRVS